LLLLVKMLASQVSVLEILVVLLTLIAAGFSMIRAYEPAQKLGAGQKETTGRYFSRIILPKIGNIASSISLVGLLFMVMDWPGFINMLMVGLPVLLAVALLKVIFPVNHEPFYNEPLVIKAFFLVSLFAASFI
jgi:hypothetical protein